MGSGGPRGLAQAKQIREVDPELGKKLSEALSVLDGLDETFKTARQGERSIQLVKIWAKACGQIDVDLQALADALNASHQVNLEPGTSGGGRDIMPWVEESGGRFDRLEIRLGEGEMLTATAGPHTVGKIKLGQESYEWLERLLIKWMVASIKLKM